jgi:tripartite-type tricarboxylate transporter receptor subunit TctC
VARAVPDGYTLGLANTTSHVVSAALNPHLPFDPIRDFVPIGMIGSSPFMLVSSPHLPAATLKQFVDLAKAKPGSLSYASAGTGTLAHLAGELFKHQANIDLVHVPYHGTEQSLLDLMEGRIDLSVSTIPPTLPQIKQGTDRALAVMSDKRSGSLPDIPTVAEAGPPGCEAALWTAIVLPAGVPAAIADRLSKTLIAVVNDPDVQKTLAAQGVDPKPGPAGRCDCNDQRRYSEMAERRDQREYRPSAVAMTREPDAPESHAARAAIVGFVMGCAQDIRGRVPA